MNQEKFNSKFSDLIRDFVSNDYQFEVVDESVRVFVLLNELETVSLVNVRVLLIAKFLVKFLNIPK